jgi:hypothetical protein
MFDFLAVSEATSSSSTKIAGFQCCLAVRAYNTVLGAHVVRNVHADATAMRLGHFGDLKAVQIYHCGAPKSQDFSSVWRFAPSASVLKAHDTQNAAADADGTAGLRAVVPHIHLINDM